MRNADRFGVVHGSAQVARGHLLVAFKFDLADLYLGAFFNVEGDADGGRGNLADFGGDGGELTTVRGQQFLQYDFGFLYPGGVELAFLAKPHLQFLEFIKHIALRNRIESDVFNFANGRFFLHVNMKNPTLGALFALDAKIVKIARVP